MLEKLKPDFLVKVLIWTLAFFVPSCQGGDEAEKVTRLLDLPPTSEILYSQIEDAGGLRGAYSIQVVVDISEQEMVKYFSYLLNLDVGNFTNLERMFGNDFGTIKQNVFEDGSSETYLFDPQKWFDVLGIRNGFYLRGFVPEGKPKKTTLIGMFWWDSDDKHLYYQEYD